MAMTDVGVLYDHVSSGIIGRIGITRQEAELFCSLVHGHTYLEIGSLWGGTAILAALEGATRVISVDVMIGGWWITGDPIVGGVPSADNLRRNAEKFGVEDEITWIRANSRLWPVPANLFDVIMVDGDHSYEGCTLDLDNALKFAKKFVLVHDVDDNHPGVIRAIQDAPYLDHYPCYRQTMGVGSFILLERQYDSVFDRDHPPRATAG